MSMGAYVLENDWKYATDRLIDRSRDRSVRRGKITGTALAAKNTASRVQCSISVWTGHSRI